MDKRRMERFTGLTLGINPLFTLVGLIYMTFAKTKGIFGKIRSDKVNLWFWGLLAISGVISIIVAVHLPTAIGSFLIPFIFIWLYILGRWCIDFPDIFFQDFLRGVGFLALIATLAKIFGWEWSVGNIRILGKFAHSWQRGEIFYIADNSLGLIFQAGIIGAFGSIGLYWREKKYIIENLIIFILSCCGLLISGSRGAMVGVFIGFLFLVLQYAILGVLGIGSMAGLFAFFSSQRFKNVFNMQSHSVRLKIWESSIRIIKEHPWFGVGPGNFGQVIDRYRVESLKGSITCAHSNYLNIIIGWGIIGGVIFWGWHIFVLVRAILRGLSPLQRIIMAIFISYLAHVAINDLFTAYAGFFMGMIDHPIFMQSEQTRVDLVVAQGTPES